MLADLQLLRPQWLLALLPLLLLWVWLARQARSRRSWEDLVDPHLRDAVLAGDRQSSFRVLLILLALAWVLLVAAMAGPVWQRESRPVYRIEQPRLLVLDLSIGMNSGTNSGTNGDEDGPTRLERARFEILDLLRAADEGQIGLIGYGPEPFVIAPLTTDAATIIEQVPVLAPDLLPLSGEGRADLALDMAAALLRRSGAAQGDVILVAGSSPQTDEALDLALKAAAKLRANGHRLSVLAVSDAPAFEQLARVGGGLLLRARADDLDTERLLALAGKRGPTTSGDRIATDDEWRDEGHWLLLLLLPLAALAFRRGWLGLLPIALLLTPPSPAQAWTWQDLWLRPEQQALRVLEDGRADDAGERFAEPRWRAAALYRAGRYQQALDALAGQPGAEAHYNRGNTLAQLGRYEDAIAEYDAALLIDSDHEDARHNRGLLQRIGQRPDAASADALGSDSEQASANTAGSGNADNPGSTGRPADQPDGGSGGLSSGRPIVLDGAGDQGSELRPRPRDFSSAWSVMSSHS